ncbi:MAG TPA: aldehyde dehydrogenase family protein [Paenirhodobacter sp.]
MPDASALLPSDMLHCGEFYIDGGWRTPVSTETLVVEDPSTIRPVATIALGSSVDVDRAVAAARAARATCAALTVADRIALLERIADIYERRMPQMATLISTEMGAPARLALRAQAAAGLGHFRQAAQVLADFPFETRLGNALVTREAIGVCALITPWNWPMNQIVCKVAPAIAAGCTMVLKPSELAPLSALLLAEILDEAGLPPGMFNLVNGTGAVVGDALSRHPDVDLVSFTGSNGAGQQVAINAAPTVKRVHLELGGKSPNILLDDVDFAKAVPSAVRAYMMNSGQSCDAPSRLLVPQDRLDQVEALAAEAANALRLGAPDTEGVFMGPVVSRGQFDRIQALIAAGITQGAGLIAGGPGHPDGLETGHFVRPTVFSRTTTDMRIVAEEIFGPVLCIQTYSDEADAIRIANDTPYGLSAYVSSADPARAERVARQIRAGMVHINGAPADFAAPFGGYKASGNGSEWGKFGLEAYLETKSMFGHS